MPLLGGASVFDHTPYHFHNSPLNTAHSWYKLRNLAIIASPQAGCIPSTGSSEGLVLLHNNMGISQPLFLAQCYY